jgi:hypothetical protein
LTLQIWPSDFTSGELMRSFGEWLAVTYDLPQRTAIEVGGDWEGCWQP